MSRADHDDGPPRPSPVLRAPHEFYKSMVPKGAPSEDDVAALLRQQCPDLFAPDGSLRTVQARTQVEREVASDGRQLVALADRARRWAKDDLLNEIPLAERVRLAAPPPTIPRPMSKKVFDWRNPTFSESRHGPFADCVEHGSLIRRAQKLGLSSSKATATRTELMLIKLVNGQAPLWPLDGRQKHLGRDTDTNTAAAAIFSEVWSAHTYALGEAERRKLVRDTGEQPLRTDKAAMFVMLFEAMTTLRTYGSPIAARALLKALSRTVEMFKEEAQSA